jgi:microcystin degradation protein MlrC
VADLLLTDLRECRHLDAVYLDLHGAMVAEHIDDADGELLRRVRALVGDAVPIVASLDFHANVSPLMVREASGLVAYRTYPHVDMAESGERALRCLHDMADRPLFSQLRQLPFLIPLTSQCTLIDPFAVLMREVADRERAPVVAMNFTPGFPAADVAECGPAVFAYGADEATVEREVDRMAQAVAAREAEFALEIFSIDTALREVAHASPRGRPCILADTQDNPGGGGTADTTSLIKALIGQCKQRVLAGVVCDGEAAARAHAAGVGAQIDIALGAGSRIAGETPIRDRFEVVALGDGRFTATGPFYRGSRMELGLTALLRVQNMFIAVASRKQQAADQAMFRHLGAEPRDFGVLVLKSSVHFRADFGPMASRVLVVDAPGANIADPARLPFRKLRPGMRLSPRR